MKQIYLDIKEQVENNIPELEAVGMSNKQFERAEAGQIDGLLFPCCFIQMTDFNYIKKAEGLSSFTGIVRLHIGFESFEVEDLEIFDVVEKIHSFVEGFTPEKCQPLNLRLQDMPDNFTNVIVFILEFGISGTDTTGYKRRNLVEANIETLDVKKDLKLHIENTEIRTGREINL